ncbi:hypothetical protein RO3G_01532 [Rhizopus delemar RA 99-880]|uniref:Reverse transcriptase domain-containing protein n=1 Tax=Rhizopus delemar (strain RA 99-880 / ATCC MYA-4621 / FGSC 9543 / NRRL 43880) TaxID=246409 RepID=I1BKU8_RHIO9|nr:hypothetical protein RO3G_01532 [Rhizopus delemar RA 99-880]|eukprot:EIE76828.1 hypothetical protein RO3G_01532 [Rhizopus delemar RA 99-880]
MEEVPTLREMIEKDDYICKIDLKDAYVVVPIHESSKDFLTFLHQGIIYIYRSLAFRLNIAPRIFSKIMKYALEPLRKIGLRFVFYLYDICVDQIRSISPATIASWIQQVMQDADIDTSIHKAHSLRAAASTWAVIHGHNIEQVKKHANWSNQSNTFEKYYFKPFNKFQESQSINNTIFSATENNTISSEPETEATRIGTSMPSNLTVASVSGSDEMVAHPSTFNWISSLLFPSQ